MPSNIGTRNLFMDVLSRIGAHCHVDESNEDVVFFEYQDEHFVAFTSKNTLYVQIYDLHWMSINVYNIDEVADFKRAINNSNRETAVNTYYEIDEERMNMVASSKILIMIIPSIPKIEEYLEAVLAEFFRDHKMILEGVYSIDEAHNA